MTAGPDCYLIVITLEKLIYWLQNLVIMPDTSMPYRTESMLIRDTVTGALKQSSQHQYESLQSLPLFMDSWGIAAIPRYGTDRIITSTINVSDGCLIGKQSLCGQFCFSHLSWNGDSVRRDTALKYERDARKLSQSGHGTSIFLSTDTEPLPGKGDISEITLDLLKVMTRYAPHGLVLHTHTDVAANPEYLAVLRDLSQVTNLLVGIGFETDTELLPQGLPAPYTSIKDRLRTIEMLANKGIKTQAAVAPLVGFRDFESFARVFPQLGTYRIMVGDLRLCFATGGTEKARTLKERLGLPAPSQEDAKRFFETLGYPEELVAFRDQFYVVLPEF